MNFKMTLKERGNDGEYAESVGKFQIDILTENVKMDKITYSYYFKEK